MADSFEPLSDHPVVPDVERGSALRLDEQARPVDDSVTQRVDELETAHGSPLTIRAAPRGRRVHQEPPYQVERDDAQYLPSAVRLEALCRHAIKGEAALELSVHLLVGAAPAHEKPQRASSD